MPTDSILSSAKVSKSSLKKLPGLAYRLGHVLADRAPGRFALVAGVSCTLTLIALGLLDPQTLVLACRADAQSAALLLTRAEVALRNMNLLEQLATGGCAVLALAAMSAIGYLRTEANPKTARESAVD